MPPGRARAARRSIFRTSAIALVVVVLAVVFYFANVPDIKSRGRLSFGRVRRGRGERRRNSDRKLHHALIYFLLLFNSAVLLFAIRHDRVVDYELPDRRHVLRGIASRIPHPAALDDARQGPVIGALRLAAAVAVLVLIDGLKHIASQHWSHPHFPAAILAQFFYVAAQAGIFSFFINCMTPNVRTGFCMVPAIPAAFDSGLKAIAVHLLSGVRCRIGFERLVRSERRRSAHQRRWGSALQSVGFVCFLAGACSARWLLKKFSAHKVLGTLSAFSTCWSAS